MKDFFSFFLKYSRKCLRISLGKFLGDVLVFPFLSFYLKLLKKKEKKEMEGKNQIYQT